MVIPTMIRGKTMTHLVFSDTFNLSHVSRSASVILETLMKLGASRCGVCLPWILLWARSSFWRSGAFLKFVSTGSLSWVLRTQATIGFTSSGWFWSLLIWFRPPHYWKSQVRGRGADKQNVKHGNLEAGGRSERTGTSFSFSKVRNDQSCRDHHRMGPGALCMLGKCSIPEFYL